MLENVVKLLKNRKIEKFTNELQDWERNIKNKIWSNLTFIARLFIKK